MAEKIDPRQQHLDDHYGDLGLYLVDEPTGGTGKGMTSAEAATFLQHLKPLARVRQTLAQAAKKVTHKG
jgi:hypothetical protein